MTKLTTIKLKRNGKFIHLVIVIWIFRFSFYKLKEKFSMRWEISYGWDK